MIILKKHHQVIYINAVCGKQSLNISETALSSSTFALTFWSSSDFNSEELSWAVDQTSQPETLLFISPVKSNSCGSLGVWLYCMRVWNTLFQAWIAQNLKHVLAKGETYFFLKKSLDIGQVFQSSLSLYNVYLMLCMTTYWTVKHFITQTQRRRTQITGNKIHRLITLTTPGYHNDS